MLPQLRRPFHPAAPPLGTFAHIGPFGILGDITQAGHDRLEYRHIGFGDQVEAAAAAGFLQELLVGLPAETLDRDQQKRGCGENAL